MPLPFLIPAIISGISALGGALSNRKKTITSDSTSTQNIDRTTTQMPTYDPRALAMRDSLISAFMGRLEPGAIGNLANTITTGNIQNINRGFGAQRRILEESFANRGLNFSPVAATVGAESESNRIGNVIQALNQRALIAEQMRQANLEGAGGFFSRLPVGTTATEKGTVSQTGRGAQVDPGNILGGMFSSLSSMLGGLFGAGAFDPNGRGVQGVNFGYEPQWYPAMPPIGTLPPPPPVHNPWGR